jgi:uncharacterized membrane protein
MSNKLKFLQSATLAIATLSVISSTAFAADKKDMEKCYGVVKAGKNDCAAKDGTHSCAGSAKVDSSKNEWVLLPKGTCDKLVGGIKG